MKHSIFNILMAILLISTTTYSQQGVIGISYTKSYVDKDFHVSKVYYKGTNTQVPEETFNQLVEENPNLFLESVIDSEGRITRYLYDPNLKDSEFQTITDSPQKGSFPNFKLTTISNDTIILSELKGKIVILRFEMEATTFRFKKHEIQELDDKINGLANKDSVAAIIVFDTSKSNVEKGFDLKDSNFKLVANGRNFIEKYGIKYFPSTLVIDQNGSLIDIFRHVDEIDLESYLKK
ncbi:redoxin domain-containing protein [uncultured Gelidibacter sp.]|uniref:TlpA family protein disulfide reductase n=1 Tax=uncultured Gelidibacter sp. TaxID=259318 RepID=UPI0026384F07|nr:redoxin domain-containing protein [uncultured Gelidibacter sp.]